jgi:hypothetical protein
MPPLRLLLLACLALAFVPAPTGAQAPNSPSTVAGPPARIALVTGSTGGLGRELARRLAAEGAHVIVHGRNAARGAALVNEITSSGKGSARFFQADLASLAAVRRFADENQTPSRRSVGCAVSRACQTARRHERGLEDPPAVAGC